MKRLPAFNLHCRSISFASFAVSSDLRFFLLSSGPVKACLIMLSAALMLGTDRYRRTAVAAGRADDGPLTDPIRRSAWAAGRTELPQCRPSRPPSPPYLKNDYTASCRVELALCRKTYVKCFGRETERR